MSDEHTKDLWNVNEGDEATLTTSGGETFDAECTERSVENADPRTGEIRETTMWVFDGVEYKLAITIIQGLGSSEDDPEFPVHKEAWDIQQQGTMGYVESLDLHGQKLES